MNTSKNNFSVLNQVDTLYTYFKARAALYQNQLAFIYLDSYQKSIALTFKALLEQVDSFSQKLAALQLSPQQDNIAILSPSNLTWVIVTLAAAKLGLPLICLKNNNLEEIKYNLNKLNPTAIFIDENYLSMLNNNQFSFVSSRIDNYLVTHAKNCFGLTKLTAFNNALIQDEVIENNAECITYHDPMGLLWWCFSSGTSGAPKAIGLSHYNVVNNSVQLGEAMEYAILPKNGASQHRVLSVAPYFPAGGLIAGIFSVLFQGSTIICGQEPFDESYYLKLLEWTQATVLLGPPTLIGKIAQLQANEKKTLAIETIMLGSTLCSYNAYRNIYQGFKSTHFKLNTTYGQTEAGVITHFGSFLSHNIFADCKNNILPVGVPLPYVTSKIITLDYPQKVLSAALPANTRGTIVTHTYSMATYRYYNDSESNQNTFFDDWLLTGDIGFIGDNGLLYVEGRLKDLFINPQRVSEKILPIDIELVLLNPPLYPEIEDIQIIGLTLSGNQFVIGAAIKSKTNLDTLKLKTKINQRCKDFNLPDIYYVSCVLNYPLNSSKKIDRLAIAEQMKHKIKIENPNP